MDLATVSEETSKAACAARQLTVFQDETGKLGWTPIGGFLMDELRDLLTQLSAALPSRAGARVVKSVRQHWVGFSRGNGEKMEMGEFF